MRRGHNTLKRYHLGGALLALVLGLNPFSWPLSESAEYREAAAQTPFTDSARISLRTATELVRKKTGGRILSANPASKGNYSGFKVRVLVDEHKVQTWFVDQQGQVRGN